MQSENKENKREQKILKDNEKKMIENDRSAPHDSVHSFIHPNPATI